MTSSFKNFVLLVQIILCCDAKLKWSSRLFKRVTKGVGPENLQHYEYNKEFRCLKSGGLIPYSWINDDYCDCFDGSDEPGTAACPNNVFYCNNIGFKPQYILSSRVNDGVCDCCDGSDEYSQYANCQDYCQILGDEIRRENERMRKSLEEGHKKYPNYCKLGDQLKEEKKAGFSDLQAELKFMQNLIFDLEKVKEETDKIVWELKNLARKRANEELNEKQALEVFRLIDANKDERVDDNELKAFFPDETFSYNDSKTDSEGDLYPMDFDNFESMWPTFKEAYLNKLRFQKHRPHFDIGGHDDDDNTEGPNDDNSVAANYDSNHIDDDENMDDDDVRVADDPDESYDDDSIHNNDSETMAAMDRAHQSQEDIKIHKSKLEELKKKIAESLIILVVDGGKYNEFLPLVGQCFDFEDTTYIYTFCPLVGVTQKFKDISDNFHLGRWDSWVGGDENMYSMMYYKDGSECWDGPNRSTTVSLECGDTEMITSVSEPKRCEYAIIFKTPASCTTPPPSPPHHHDPSDL